MERPKPLVLAICDGWGVAPDAEGNAIAQARTPNYDRFISEYPAMTLYASGNEVGLQFGEMGNSEVGHLNIGAGRVYYQTFPRINKSISDGTFFENEAFIQAANHVKNNKSSLHLVGLLSSGNVHASQDHLYALLDFAKRQKIKNVYIHIFLDGRDTGEKTALMFISKLKEQIKNFKRGVIATVSGRFYGLDRDNRWERVELAYRAMADGISSEYYKNPEDAVNASYEQQIFDEQFVPVVIGQEGRPTATVDHNDAVIFFNFRPDRARELTQAFVLPGFSKFERVQKQNLFFVTMTEYEKETPVVVAFPPVVVTNCLAEVISKAGLKQFHVAETEKYAHVTFFLNGTVEDSFVGEDRKIIPSPKVASYDQAPEMSAQEITKEVVNAIESNRYDFIVLNYANADMVGHTGNFAATIQGVEEIDRGFGAIADHVLAKNGVFLITADHGNAEIELNLQTKEKNKEHSTNPVPLLVIGQQFQGQAGPAGDPPNGDLSLIHPVGMLADVAPTIISLLGLELPPEMTGRSLI